MHAFLGMHLLAIVYIPARICLLVTVCEMCFCRHMLAIYVPPCTSWQYEFLHASVCEMLSRTHLFVRCVPMHASVGEMRFCMHLLARCIPACICHRPSPPLNQPATHLVEQGKQVRDKYMVWYSFELNVQPGWLMESSIPFTPQHGSVLCSKVKLMYLPLTSWKLVLWMSAYTITFSLPSHNTLSWTGLTRVTKKNVLFFFRT